MNGNGKAHWWKHVPVWLVAALMVLGISHTGVLLAQEPADDADTDADSGEAASDDDTPGLVPADNANGERPQAPPLAEKQKKIGPIIFPAGRSLKEVVEWIGDEVGVNIVLAPKVEETVPEIRLRQRVYWRHVLDYIAELTNCEVKEVSPVMFELMQPPKVNMQFRNADLKVVLDLLARQSGANIVIAPDVTGKVSLNLRNVRWDVALSTIVETLGYITVREESNILRVVTPASLKTQLKTRIFQLAYIRPPDNYIAVMKAGGSGADGKAARGFWERQQGDVKADRVERFTLYQALKKMISPDPINGRLEYDLTTNSFLVTDTKPKLDEMAEIIAKVDVPPEQVYVDVKFIRTTRLDMREQGIRFDTVGTPEEDGIIVKHGFPDPTSSATTMGGRTSDRLYDRGGTYWWDVGRWETLREGFSTLGILDFTQTEMALRLIHSDQNSRIIQAPKLLTLNNQEAVIFVGESVPYAQQEATADQSGNIIITLKEDDNSPVSVGFTLFITPHVVKGSDEIMLTVIPRTSTLVGTSQAHPGFERFEAEIAQNVTAYLDLPRTLEQTIVTKMLVRDGNTAVIGGLISEDTRESVAKIPLLSSIPIIGNLFTWRREYTTKENLIIFITPRIVRSMAQSARLAREQVALQKQYDYFYDKYKAQATREEERNLGTVLTDEEERLRREEEERIEAMKRRKAEAEEAEETEEPEESWEDEEPAPDEFAPEEEEFGEDAPEDTGEGDTGEGGW